MAAPTPAERQTALAALSKLSKDDLAALWRKLNLGKPDALADPLVEILSALVDRYGSAAAALAADWYDEDRAAARAAGRFTAIPAEAPTAERLGALARWGVGPLFGANPDGNLALSLISGGTQRLVADMFRETTVGSLAADPAEPRYARHASANACAFCAMLASRGPVYTSESATRRVTGVSLGGRDYRKLRRVGDTAQNRAAIQAGTRQAVRERGGRAARASLKRSIGDKYHDDCHCIAVPVWPGQDYKPAPYVAKWEQAYTDATGSGKTGTTEVLAAMRESLGTG